MIEAGSDSDARILQYLRSPSTIRERANYIYALAEKNQLDHFSLHPEKYASIADFVYEDIKQGYPDLNIPYHSRWRHFEIGGLDREKILTDLLQKQKTSTEEMARCKIELAIVSVLLDAGAGAKWQYREERKPHPAGVFSRSEGLAVASFWMYVDGLFTNDKTAPLSVHGKNLAAQTPARIGDAMQVSAANPMVGYEGRCAVLKKLGEVLLAGQGVFGKDARLGNFFDYLIKRANGRKEIESHQVLGAVLEQFSAIWPGRISLGGENLGDVWQHSKVKTTDASSGLVPFHKLSQWLTYSLFEPLEGAGYKITNVNSLTGLPEYRNGGLFLDLALFQFKNAADTKRAFKPDAELVVEWRALTVAALDRLAGYLRKKLNMTETDFPLVKLLQGGTWTSGRRIAKKLRPDGGPPFEIISDGTVF